MVDLDAVKERIDQVVDEHADSLLAASHEIHQNPELGFHEHEAHRILTELLGDAGLDVSPGAYGIKTAFEATAGTEGPRIAVLVEVHPPPPIGPPWCQNVVGTAGAGAGIAAA